MTYSFKFMQTDSDREALKKAMIERLEKARQKLNARKQGKVGALVRSNLPRQQTTFDMTSKSFVSHGMSGTSDRQDTLSQMSNN